MRMLDLKHGEVPPYNRKVGDHVLRKYIDLTNVYIKRWFEKEKQFVVSFLTAKENA